MNGRWDCLTRNRRTSRNDLKWMSVTLRMAETRHVLDQTSHGRLKLHADLVASLRDVLTDGHENGRAPLCQTQAR